MWLYYIGTPRESHQTAEQALEYDEAFKEQLEKEREAFVVKVMNIII